MTDQTYNGWKNYETWAVGMFLDGNYTGEGTYREVLELVRDMQDLHGADSFRIEVADALKQFVDDHLAQTTDELPGCLATDLLRAAVDDVDWRELAAAKIAEVLDA